ncbi:class I SAM-dependent methyltransferase [Mixta intestinalis]|uniref:Ubiquinone/menaquinone biosynthesis C-methyltransferase UbiE n=1 Tax=Mixta intestinalis TaxID=1615494 RepID=A0A6P1Q4R1_9GAMM|nr:class I SAM-dependent methyltransferase [Mixta intestinalis]QHM73057.1 Ubiquinone/menaquinone biosynthesis C-methyltransferase UbiE [Mixta intestinalis]
MLINNIDFADLYRQQWKLNQRTEKAPEHWDKRAEKFALSCDNPDNAYLKQLLEKIDLQDAGTLLDMGCGPGSVCLPLADKLIHVYGVDYSQGMLQVARQRAQQAGIDNLTLIRRAWEESWDDLPICDIAVASRSTLVADLRQALTKLNQKARLRVYTTHLVTPYFISPLIQRALGREVTTHPTYIYAVNLLYQMGIHACVDFIRDARLPPDPDDFERFAESVSWSGGTLSSEDRQRLYELWQEQRRLGRLSTLLPPRDWALVWWDTSSTAGT